MKILLTGGTGFIGQSLCVRLTTQGHTLTVLSRRPGKVSEFCGKSVASINSIKLLKPDDHFDAIINLAGEGSAQLMGEIIRKSTLFIENIIALIAIIPNRRTTYQHGRFTFSN